MLCWDSNRIVPTESVSFHIGSVDMTNNDIEMTPTDGWPGNSSSCLDGSNVAILWVLGMMLQGGQSMGTGHDASRWPVYGYWA